jgi:RNA 2',3'-cyclic 3'-phosphodiesterase
MGRYFVGIEVPPEIGGRPLTELQERLEPILNVKRWYGPEQFHITTQFLGELNEEQLEAVKRLLARETQGAKSFQLQLGQPGWFPRAKVVWCGVQGDLEALSALQARMADAFRQEPALDVMKFAHDRYRPHITLGRLREADPSVRLESAVTAEEAQKLIGGVSWQVGAVRLFESVSAGHGGGPEYPVRQSFPLE